MPRKAKTKLPTLPKDAWSKIVDDGPGCLALLVWADWLDEQNDPLGADALRWVHTKGRWPVDGRWTHSPIKSVPHRLPKRLQKFYDEANGELKWAPRRKPTAFRYLMVAWRTLPDSLREEFWQWDVTQEG